MKPISTPKGFDAAVAFRLALDVFWDLTQHAYGYNRQTMREFQEAAGLRPDGLYGGETAAALRHVFDGEGPAALFKPADAPPYRYAELVATMPRWWKESTQSQAALSRVLKLAVSPGGIIKSAPEFARYCPPFCVAEGPVVAAVHAEARRVLKEEYFGRELRRLAVRYATWLATTHQEEARDLYKTKSTLLSTGDCVWMNEHRIVVNWTGHRLRVLFLENGCAYLLPGDVP